MRNCHIMRSCFDNRSRSQFRSQPNRREITLRLALLVLALWLVLPHGAGAATYTYGGQQRIVNAGIVLPGAANAPLANVPNPAPYIFHVLNQRADVKPFGWNIVSPRAPASATPSISARWGYPIGQRLGPNMAAYWEVPLADTSADQLQQYDVLYLPATGVALTPADNQKLLRFVDGGGQLWVEYTNVGGTGLSALFANTQWKADGGTLAFPNTGGGTLLHHPVLSQPYLLSTEELRFLGDPNATGVVIGDAPPSQQYAALFGSVLTRPTGDAVAAAQYGAGQIVADAMNIGPGISIKTGPVFDDPNTLPSFVAAPSQDLKFLANLISLSDTHPAEQKNSHQNAANADLASFAPAWDAPIAAPATPVTPPGAAVWGNFVFVVDVNGALRAFDAYPSEDLTGKGKPDDGIPDFSGDPASIPANQPRAYDQIWTARGPFASAPTVADINGQATVLVADAKGGITLFNAVTGAAGSPALLPNSSTGSTYSGPAPSPTVYDGRVYAGEPDGTLYIYDTHPGSSAAGGINLPMTLDPTESALAAPTVGVVPEGDTSNYLTALVPTAKSLYSVLLGARGDTLRPGGGGYNVNRGRFGTDFTFMTLDANTNHLPRGYSLDGATQLTFGTSPDFNGGGVGSYYADYDIDFANAQTQNKPLNLSQISAYTYSSLVNGGTLLSTAVFSAPAQGKNGDFYYTLNVGANSYLIGVQNSPQFRSLTMKFRFRLPAAGEAVIDGDNVDYSPLAGFQFVGAPVLDAEGRVYAIARNGNAISILSFDSDGEVYAVGPDGFDAAQQTYQQSDEFGSAQANEIRPGGNIPNDPNPSAPRYGQFLASGSRVTFFNFGLGTATPHQFAASLSEPQPVTALATTTNGGANPQAATGAAILLPLHTNLRWYTLPFTLPPGGSGITGLVKSGDTLFFSDGARLYSLNGSPKSISRKQVDVGTGKPDQVLQTTLTTNIGAVRTLSVGAGVMALNGTNGVAALTQQRTIVADNNRILEVDAQGSAVWGIDSTQRDTGDGVQTRVDFSHPTSLSEAAANDYLIADTGNNRCVRFDRAGSVLWELTRFSDPNGLLAPGQPLTLSQPSSVELRRTQDTNGDRLISYLVADSGHNRIVEVTDRFTTAGIGPDHVLTWVSHTGDRSGRNYRYGSATYFQTPTGLLIAALVANTRLAPLVNGEVGPARGDSPGGSIVLFNYAPGALAYGAAPIPGTPSLAGLFNSFQVPGPTQNLTVSVLNPRFLSLYLPPTPPAAGQPAFSFLYADDNGAFDLAYDTTNQIFFAGGLHFSRLNYQAMSSQRTDTDIDPITGMARIIPAIPVDAAGDIAARNRFQPTSVQRLGLDANGNPRYLITQSSAQGELGDPQPVVLPGNLPVIKIGGEVFEVRFDKNAATPAYFGVGSYGSHTLSRPDNTGPLTQPTAAIRPQ